MLPSGLPHAMPTQRRTSPNAGRSARPSAAQDGARATTPTTAAAALALALALPGCGTIKTMFASIGQAVEQGSESLSTRRYNDDPITFSASGPLAVDVDSFGGDVTIRADPQRKDGMISLTRRATHGYGRKAEADIALADIDFHWEIAPGDPGPILKVSTSTANPEPYFLRADITIDLPEIEGVRVHTNNGDVLAEGVSGAVDILTSDGEVRLMTPRAMVRPVTIVNNSGDIDYRIRAESTGRFDCEVVRGKVIAYAEYGNLIVHEGTDANTLVATLNDGKNPIVLRAVDGTIRIAVVAAPTEVGAKIVD